MLETSRIISRSRRCVTCRSARSHSASCLQVIHKPVPSSLTDCDKLDSSLSSLSYTSDRYNQLHTSYNYCIISFKEIIFTMSQPIEGRKVLLLGSGFVTKPTVELLSNAGIEVTVACRTLESAKKLSQGIKNTKAISLDVNDSAALDAELSKVDLVVSLIPYTHHATVIKGAIRTKKNVVTTSYVSPAMMELEKEVKEAGITVMNEIGLDPGIDHLYAVKTISEVHDAGGKITSFLSYCGGLPAPECSNNPLGYKFSWSSRIPGPSRDDPHTRRYGLPQRRSEGFPRLPHSLERSHQKILGATSSSEKDLEWAISSRTKFPTTEEKYRILSGLRWVGIFSDENIIPRGNPLDTLCATLESKMQYEDGERDMVMLQHRFEIEHADGSKETRTSTLCDYGDPNGYSSMAKLVGIPCGVAVKQVLDGTISAKGILAPMSMDICAPLIKTLKEEHGIEMIEKTV
ncbi:saccharopine dehydrogenase (NADP+, L-glutamate forming) [Blastomyces dermatitidis ER-3]|uniref:Saccharopine dehydrogenase (NADP+, L-glutamate forming) n=1 Tax=Ajellomyces dermatitidis (strain ER-3 / ATCC MYA-2586) TaxID=559297 RepID=A0ABX2W0U9_AJEDR|nr:saccharopine dehydrogenase (NADP+, L-glutamate forming) [Blastomyces dermatitidis ER-3]OAT03013.1 saccharopine dehydrogenase (NADP+, L-glutamate forming) [Blastomyces dermatitidis ER-3]